MSTPDRSALISLRNVTKRYGRKSVLKGMGLTVEAGQVMALLGANGAGKTTLMRLVAGLSKPDLGDVTLGGANFGAAGSELRRYVGYVGHAPLLYDALSAWENLLFFAELYDMQRPEARIEALLKEVKLWSRRRDLVRTYSRGMVQRLTIARALLHDPPVLLLDEPDTGLDQASIGMLHGLIRRLGAENRAILLSTHSLDQALAWSDRVGILAGGKIAYQESTNALKLNDLRQRYQEYSQP